VNTEFICTVCRDILPDYAVGTSSVAESSIVENHLTHCAECRQELAQWRAMVEITRQAEALAPAGNSATLWSAIQSQISSESPVVSGDKRMEFNDHSSKMDLVSTDLVTSPTTPSRTEQGSRRRTNILAVVAAVLFVVLVSMVLALRPHHPGVATSTTPTPPVTSTSTLQSTPVPSLPPGTLLPPDTSSNAVTVLSANDIWAIGSIIPSEQLPASQIVHYDGKQWQVSSTYTSTWLRSISMDSASDGWAVGITDANSNTDPNAKPFFLHYTGGTWVTVTITNMTFRPSQVQMLSANDGWAFGLEGDNQAAFHYSNGAWREVPVTLPTQASTLDMPSYSAGSAPPTPQLNHTPQFTHVQMFSDTEGWAIGAYQSNNFVWRLHNGQWSASYTTALGPSFAFGANAPNDAWLTRSASNAAATTSSGTEYGVLQPASRGLSLLLHYDGNTWSIVQWPAGFGNIPTGLFYDGARWLSSAAGVDSSGNFQTTLLHNQNGQWSATSLPSTISDVVSIIDQPDGSILALAYNENNAPSFTTMKLLRYANGTWNVVH
jgi:hypothetical protein